LPGVVSASATTFVPMGGSGGGNGRRAEIEGYTPRPDEVVGIVTDAVAPGYVRTMGMKLAAGRDIAAADTAGAPGVALVNTAFVRRYFGEHTSAAEAVGRRVTLGKTSNEIVGVVEDFTYRGLGQPADPTAMVSLLQDDAGSFSIVLRSSGGSAQAAALAPSLRAAVAAVDATLPVVRVETLEQHAASMSDVAVTLSRLLGACGALALILAALGLYAVVAHTVGQRRREIGLRMALGANAAGVLRMVLREGLVLAALGAGAGLLLGFGAAQLLRSLLFGVGAADPLTFVGAALVLAATAVLACLAPALSAARVEPLQALRYE